MKHVTRVTALVLVAALAALSLRCAGDDSTTMPPRPPRRDAARLEPLSAVEVDGRWGYADAEGKIVIAPAFDVVQDTFADDRAYVRVGGLRGLIDRSGQWRAGPKDWNIGTYHEGRAAIGRYVGDHYQWGFIDGDGNEVVSPQWDAVGEFEGGVAQVGNETLISRIKTSFADVGIDVDWYYIDRNGDKVDAAQVPSHPPRDRGRPR
ncbi:MAG: WG repeat-containing protein [Planctomycetaceae bacterium]